MNEHWVSDKPFNPYETDELSPKTAKILSRLTVDPDLVEV